LFAGLRRQGVYRPRPGWGALAWRVLVPTGLMALALGGGLAFAGDWYLMSTGQRIGALAALVMGGAVVYFAACHLCGLRTSELKIHSV
jgi:putative peptidoglycan lipid II flippase